MKKWVSAAGLILMLTAGSAMGQTFGAVLTGSQEVPPADPDGSGNATFTFNSDRTQLTADITFSRIGTVLSGAHIHEGPAGVNAGVVIPFITSSTTITNGRISGTFPVAADVASRLAANPSGFYVNLHNAQFPGGAIRGQLASISGAGATFVGDLTGPREVPGPGHSTATGSFVVSINEARNQVSFAIVTNGLTNIIASHIHGPNGPAGVEENVFVGLAAGSAYVNGQAQGTVPVTTDQAAAIIANPANFYVNVHTTEFPGGAIRGQLVVSSITAGNTVFLPVIGRVTGATDTFVTDVRIFNPSFDQSSSVTVEFFNSNGTTQFASVAVPARGTAVLNDIISTTFNTSGIGGARISSSSRVVASSRIFADRRAAGGGTLGQFFPSVTPLRRGILTQLSHLVSSTTGLRTNIGLFNPNDVSVTVRLELRGHMGNSPSPAQTLTLAPRSFRQDALTVLFPSVTMFGDGTLTFDASSPIIVYASVVDNVTTDPTAIIATEDTGVATAP